VGGDYSFPLSAKWTGRVGADWRYVGRTQDSFPNPRQVRFVHPAYDVLNLRIGVSNDRWTLTAYAKNLGNKLGQTSAINFGTFTRGSVIQPRTFELSLSTTF
jgi:outer membrane receptor protein involved in Fe transport